MTKTEQYTKDFELFEQLPEVFNLCIVKKLDELKELQPQYIQFSWYYGDVLLSIRAYLNNDLKSYKLMTSNIVISKKVQLQNIIKCLHSYKFNLKYSLSAFGSTAEAISVEYIK